MVCRGKLPSMKALVAGALLVAAASPAAAAGVESIVVRQGDTLLGLCRQQLENPARCRDVYRVNRLRNPDLIYPGQLIAIPVELLKGTPVAGIITFVRGGATLAGTGGNRQPLRLDERVGEGARIVTGADGAAEITFPGGSSVLLRNDSELQLVRSRAKGEFHLLRELRLGLGRVISRIRQATGREQRHLIITPSAVAGARGTTYRVSVDRDALTRSEVLDGTVVVGAQGKEVAVGGGEGTIVRKGGAPHSPIALLPPPAPLDLQPLYRADPLRISFANVSGAVACRFMLGRDREVKEVVRQQLVAGCEAFAATGLDDGSYYLQTESIDQFGLAGLPSAPLPVVVRRHPLPPYTMTPAPGASVRQGPVDFRWLKVGDATSYRLQVAPAAGFAAPLRDEPAAGTAWRADSLAAGSYLFRVASVAADGFQGEWSDPLAFTVIPPPPTPAVAPPEQAGGEMRIRVNDVCPGMTYRFQLARDASFAEVLLDRREPRPEVAFPAPTAPGSYLVRVQCIDTDGSAGAFSPPQSFEVPRHIPWWGLGVLGGVGLILGLVL
ncbi:hypothetical protein GURASL_18460 [Geotalea uraniireducens]|uniref:LysM domain-containing protein n=2 Tax=Geotalea uraniireducens TaxID=351604 RepID=A0ABM8EKS0_9BACT|nr:hypothetical protein GURASL_18460 [Geotalea uraniireducens]